MNVTLLWDIDGTLISTAKGKAKDLFSRAVSAVLDREVEPVVSDGEGRPDLEVLNLTFQHAGVEPTDEQLRAAVDALNSLSPQSLYEHERHLLEGANDALQECADQGLTQAIITGNTRQKALNKLGAFGLAKYFDTERSAFGDETHTRAEAVGLAIDRNPGSTIICIGDTPNDIQAAQANDVAVIAVATGDFAADELETYGPTQLVTSAAGIVPALERIVSSEAKRAS